MRRLLKLSVATGAALFALTAPSWGAVDTFTVNSTADVNPGGACTTDPGGCTLREAITAANADNDTTDQDRINFNFNSVLDNTVNLTAILPQIDEPVAFNSTGLFFPTISGGDTVRVFWIDTAAGDDVSFNLIAIVDGNFSTSGGGGISSIDADLTVTNSRVSSSTAGFGGGIRITNGAATIENSTIQDNTTSGQGGGIQASGGTLTVRRSTIAGNHTTDAGGIGGGISAVGATIESSTVSGNFTQGLNASGGGMFLLAPSTIRNSTISGNHTDGTSSPGGGIHSAGDAIVTNTIVANNAVASTGGPDLDETNAADDYQMSYSLVENTSGANITETVAGSNITGDPGLGPLAGYGGPTFTHRPNPGSPVIDQGASDETTDQRGFARLGQFADIPDELLGVDIGAVEVRIAPPTFVGTTPASPSTDDTPQVFGNIITGSDIDISDPRVQLYTANTGGTCSGVTGPEDTAGVFTSTGISVNPVPHNTTTRFFGTLRTNYGLSICSPTSIGYTQADPATPVTENPECATLRAKLAKLNKKIKQAEDPDLKAKLKKKRRKVRQRLQALGCP